MEAKKEKKFYGKDWNGMNEALDKMCSMEDRLAEANAINDSEINAINVAVQSISQIMNRMKDGKEITWDD